MQLLKIRYYQLKRDLGILFFIIAFGFSGLSYFVFNHPQQVGIYFSGIVVFGFYNFHQKRCDKGFIQKHFSNPTQQIQIEYQLVLLTISIPALFSDYWYCFFALHLFVFLIPYLNIKPKSQIAYNFITRYFKNDYIFISGIRKNFIALTIFLALAILLSPVKLFGLVALFLFNSSLFSFYDSNECVQLLQGSNQNPKQILYSVQASALKKMLLINVPLLLVNSIFNIDMIGFNLYFLIYNALILLTIISIKYSNYHFKIQGNQNQLKLLILIIGLFIPYLSVLGLVYYFQSRTDSINNLKNYLDDNH